MSEYGRHRERGGKEEREKKGRVIGVSSFIQRAIYIYIYDTHYSKMRIMHDRRLACQNRYHQPTAN